MSKLVCIAAPYSDTPGWKSEQDTIDVHACCSALRYVGVVALCPVVVARRTFVDRWELQKILVEKCDAVFALAGWDMSSSAGAVVEAVEALGKPVFFERDGYDKIISWAQGGT